MITIRDVAKRAGVSTATVSNALNGAHNVGAETRARVLEAAKDLGYVPNLNARLMKTRKTNNLGLFLPNIHSDFYTRLAQAMYRHCSEAGYAMLMHISDSYPSQRLAQVILSSNIDGAVILNEHLEDSHVDLLRRKRVPFVFLDKPVTGDLLSSVLVDNRMGIFQGVQYLVHTGHKRIAYLGGTNNFDSKERRQAFADAISHYRQPLFTDLLMQGWFEEKAAYGVVRSKLMELNDKQLPDAIFCANDEMAMGCIKALNDSRMSVPDQVSVLGFDDWEAATSAVPQLTTIHNSLGEMGRLAILELLRLLEGGGEGESVRIPTRLVVRSSCAVRFAGGKEQS